MFVNCKSTLLSSRSMPKTDARIKGSDQALNGTHQPVDSPEPTALTVAATLGFSMALSLVWLTVSPIRPSTAAPVVLAVCGYTCAGHKGN